MVFLPFQRKCKRVQYCTAHRHNIYQLQAEFTAGFGNKFPFLAEVQRQRRHCWTPLQNLDVYLDLYGILQCQFEPEGRNLDVDIFFSTLLPGEDFFSTMCWGQIMFSVLDHCYFLTLGVLFFSFSFMKCDVIKIYFFLVFIFLMVK